MSGRLITSYYGKRKANSAPRRMAVAKRSRPGIPRPLQRSTATERPNFKTISMRYAELQTLQSPSSLGTASFNYRANSGYDPNKTGTGHQPMGWAEYSAMYDRYVVNGAKITYSICWESSASGGPLWVSAGLQSSTGTWPDTQNARENGANVKCLMPYTSPALPLKISTSYSAKKQYGLSPEMLRNNDNIYATIDQNPTNVEIFQLLLEAGSETLSARVMVFAEIDYNVTFFDVKRNMPEDS